MFHKAKCFNHQLVRFEINSTLLNNDTKAIQNNKKHYDAIIN